MTTLTFAFTRAVARDVAARATASSAPASTTTPTSRRGASPADRAGAEQVLAPFDPATGRLDPAGGHRPDRRAHGVGGRHRRVEPPRHRSTWRRSSPPPTTLGARVFVDAVHLAPHRPIDVAALGCDVLVTSPYKWYGPHAGVLCGDPALLDALPVGQGPSGRRHAGRGGGRPGRRTSRRSPRSTAAADVPARRGPRSDRRRRGAGVRRQAARRTRRDRRRAAVGTGDDGRPRADVRLHRRRPAPRRRRRRAVAAAQVATWSRAQRTRSRPSTSSASPTRAASCASASSPTSTTTTSHAPDSAAVRALRPDADQADGGVDAGEHARASRASMTSRAPKFSDDLARPCWPR